MFKIKEQLRALYAYAALNAFQIAGASWVALLAARGFSLLEIGYAESVFHLTSLLCEVPSGMAADVFGRRRAMLISQSLTVLASLTMLLSTSMTGILMGMVLSAAGYNFASGTREALAYDSLKAANQEDGYDAYASNDMIIYRISTSTATLGAGLALMIGYRLAYMLDAALGLVCLVLVMRLKEVRTQPTEGRESVAKQMMGCFAESLSFLRGNAGAVRLIFANAAVGAVPTLLRFFLQARLPEAGLPHTLLGPALFVIGMGGALGAKAVTMVKGWRYRSVFALAACGTMVCTGLALIASPMLMCLCGFLTAFFDDLIQVRSDIRLNGMVPSEQRATLISVSSLCFSVVMMVLSPLMGMLFSL